MQPVEFIELLQCASFENVFNPYSDRCEIYDRDDGPQRRCSALLALLTVAGRVEIDSLWLGRDLGYRGGRRTGLALTDDVHVAEHAARWGIGVERATAGPMVAERTAAVIWKAIRQIRATIFLWNVFPFHPYQAEDPLTNRPHKSHERAAGEELLSQLIAILKPDRLVALGNDAASTAARLAGGRDVIHVRHPSYGGQREFLSQIRILYGIDVDRLQGE